MFLTAFCWSLCSLVCRALYCSASQLVCRALRCPSFWPLVLRAVSWSVCLDVSQLALGAIGQCLCQLVRLHVGPFLYCLVQRTHFIVFVCSSSVREHSLSSLSSFCLVYSLMTQVKSMANRTAGERVKFVEHPLGAFHLIKTYSQISGEIDRRENNKEGMGKTQKCAHQYTLVCVLRIQRLPEIR